MNSFFTKLALLLVLFFFCSQAFAQSATLVTEIAQFIERTDTAQLTQSAIAAEIDQALVKYQANLYARTLVTIQKINIFGKSIAKHEKIETLQALDKEWQNYAKTNTLGSDEYRTWSYLQSTLLPLLPIPQLIAASKLSIQYNNEALKIDKNNAVAYLQLGVTELYTPVLLGGSVDRALTFLDTAYAKAQTKYQKYLCTLWISQAYFKKNDKQKYQSYLAATEAAYGVTSFLATIEDFNSKGKILGE